MKVFSKIFLALSLLIVVASCESTKLDLLDNPNSVSPANAELDLFYNNIQLSFRNLANDASGILCCSGTYGRYDFVHVQRQLSPGKWGWDLEQRLR